MRGSSHSQSFTVFGGAYVTEDHGSSHLPPEASRTLSAARIAAVAGLLMFGISTATATKATRFWDGMRPQASHSTWMTAHFENAVY